MRAPAYGQLTSHTLRSTTRLPGRSVTLPVLRPRDHRPVWRPDRKPPSTSTFIGVCQLVLGHGQLCPQVPSIQVTGAGHGIWSLDGMPACSAELHRDSAGDANRSRRTSSPRTRSSSMSRRAWTSGTDRSVRLSNISGPSESRAARRRNCSSTTRHRHAARRVVGSRRWPAHRRASGADQGDVLEAFSGRRLDEPCQGPTCPCDRPSSRR